LYTVLHNQMWNALEKHLRIYEVQFKYVWEVQVLNFFIIITLAISYNQNANEQNTITNKVRMKEKVQNIRY
jgi:hypothetical protein